jgi:hypothetical protein
MCKKRPVYQLERRVDVVIETFLTSLLEIEYRQLSPYLVTLLSFPAQKL